jgi:hypothetical protein
MLSLHTLQVDLFHRTSETILAEFKSVTVAFQFLRETEALVNDVERQNQAFAKVIALAASLPKSATKDNANRSQAYLDAMIGTESGRALFDWFDARRKAEQKIWDMEINHVLSADHALREQAKANPDDQELREFADNMSWRFSACQYQVHALSRQAEAISELQLAMLRSHGLKIWQGRKMHLRWEGDRENRKDIAE